MGTWTRIFKIETHENSEISPHISYKIPKKKL